MTKPNQDSLRSGEIFGVLVPISHSLVKTLEVDGLVGQQGPISEQCMPGDLVQAPLDISTQPVEIQRDWLSSNSRPGTCREGA